MTNLTNLSPAEFRRLVRTGDFTSPTSGYCPGYTQANLVSSRNVTLTTSCYWPSGIHAPARF